MHHKFSHLTKYDYYNNLYQCDAFVFQGTSPEQLHRSSSEDNPRDAHFTALVRTQSQQTQYVESMLV